MAVTTTPFLMNSVEVTLDTSGGGTPVSYKCQLRRAELVPSTTTSTGGTFETFCDTFTSGGGNAAWTLELEGFQAVEDAEDLTRFLLSEEGNDLDYVITPKGGSVSATNPSYSGTCIAVPTPIGGTANNYASFTVSLPCNGAPTENVT